MKYLQKVTRLNIMLSVVTSIIIIPQQKESLAETCPCDIYATGGTPCVAAHSTVRALYGSYNGLLYQVRRASDNKTRDIGVLTPGGYANSAAQDSFCTGTKCVTTVVYDQSGKGNHLWYQGSDVVPGSPKSSPAVANTEYFNINGHKVYSLYIKPGNSYWRDGSKTGVPTGSQPEGMYMVTSGTHYNNGCCFDYGNSETTRKADAAGAMDAINFGNQCWFGNCSGSGPWVQADLEWGLFPGGSQSWNPNQKAFPHKYVTAILKNNGLTKFAIKGGNAQSGNLTTLYEGKLPNGYSPMKKQGAIILGSGGDCCKPDGGANLSEGTFYEGAITSGYPSDTTENLLQANIVDAGYGRNTTAIESFSTGSANVMITNNIRVKCSNSSLKVEFKAPVNGITFLKIYDLKGNFIDKKDITTKSGEFYNYSFNMLTRPNGNYIVKVMTGTNMIHTSKVILIK